MTMSEYDPDDVRRRMEEIRATWDPRSKLKLYDGRDGKGAIVQTPVVKIPLPEDIQRCIQDDDPSWWDSMCSNQTEPFFWWFDEVSVEVTTPEDPGRSPEITAAIFWAVGYESSEDGFFHNEFPDKYSWDIDSGEFTYVGPRDQEPNSIRENPCWCLVQPSIRAAMAANP